jgi:predicted aspartyl protease
MHWFFRYACLTWICLYFVAQPVAPAFAQDRCSAPIAQLAMDYDDRGRPLVSVSIENYSEFMLLDIGGGLSALEMDLVRELGLPQVYSEIGMTAVTGESSNMATRAGTFALGAIEKHDIALMILPGFDYELSPGEPGGILALDFFADYDLAFDFMSDEFLVLPPGACALAFDGNPAEGSAVIPILETASDFITVPVFLDGVEFVGLLDTGAEYSVLNLDIAARQFGIDVSRPDDQMILADSFGYVDIYERRFAELKIGDVTLAEPRFRLFPDLLRGNQRVILNGEEMRLPQMILGMDVLRAFDLYLSPDAQLAVFTKRSIQ